MLKIINISEIIVAISLIVSILMQNRGAGLSSSFGGDFGGYYSKRGFEKFLFSATVVLGTLFLIVAVVLIYLTSKGGA